MWPQPEHLIRLLRHGTHHGRPVAFEVSQCATRPQIEHGCTGGGVRHASQTGPSSVRA
jgi:hypothetical protein